MMRLVRHKPIFYAALFPKAPHRLPLQMLALEFKTQALRFKFQPLRFESQAVRLKYQGDCLTIYPKRYFDPTGFWGHDNHEAGEA